MSETIVFYDAKPYDRRFFDLVNQEHGYAIRYVDAHLTPETVALAEGARCVCAFVNDDCGQEVIDGLADRGVELVALRSAGYNHVDLEAAYERIHVVRVPAYSPHAVAEHTVALLLSLCRKIHKAFYRTRDANFAIDGLLGFDLVGKRAGVIGTGKIGRLVAEILRGFGMEVLVYDIKPDQDWAAGIDARYVELADIYRQCRVISLHCPLTPQTHHLIDAAALETMGDDTVLINTGRGGLVDTAALVEVLRTGAIGAAALDVYEEESQYFFEDFSSQVISDDILARLIGFPNVLITSHQGFFTAEALEAIARTTLGNVDAYFANEALDNEVCYRCDGPCDKGERGRCF